MTENSVRSSTKLPSPILNVRGSRRRRQFLSHSSWFVFRFRHHHSFQFSSHRSYLRRIVSPNGQRNRKKNTFEHEGRSCCHDSRTRRGLNVYQISFQLITFHGRRVTKFSAVLFRASTAGLPPPFFPGECFVYNRMSSQLTISGLHRFSEKYERKGTRVKKKGKTNLFLCSIRR